MQAKHLLNKCPLIYGRPFTVADTNISPKSFLSVRKYNGNGLKYAVDPYYFSEDDCLFSRRFRCNFFFLSLIHFELISINIPLATKSHAKTHSLSLTHTPIYYIYINTKRQRHFLSEGNGYMD